MKLTITAILILLFSLVTHLKGQNQECDTILYPNANSATVLNGLLSNIKPGSTICLEAGNYYQMRFDNINGDSLSPIIIKPKNEKVTIVSDAHYGVRFGMCSNLMLIGNNSDSVDYNIYISKIKGNAISVDERSTDITISGVEVYDVAICGVTAKTDPDCSFSTVRDSFLLKNLTIENCKFVKTGTEGLYIGNSFFSGYTIHCNGKDTVVLPHLLSNITIRNNCFDSTGYDGIQITSALLGCRIYGNQIFHDSQVERYGQMSGIIIGGGSLAECYNNFIADGKGIGIEVHGTGGTRIYNNIIVNTGLNYHPGEHGSYGKSGIMIMYNLYNPKLLPYTIVSNTIVSPKTEGIRFSNINSSNNIIKNNLIVNPGAFALFTQQGFPYSTSFVNFNINVSSDVSNNSFLINSDSAGFINSVSNDFRLLPTSTVIDAGQDLTHLGINFDYSNKPRPSGRNFDIGAFEYYPEQSTEQLAKNQDIRFTFLNAGCLLIENKTNGLKSGKLSIISLNGEIAMNQSIILLPNTNTINLKKHLQMGIYIVRFANQGIHTSQKILLIH